MDYINSVLIIEDTPDHAELVRLALSHSPGWDVTIAESMSQATALIAQHNYHVIISDLNLPDSDRQTTVGMIKAIAPDTPLLVMTCDNVDTDGNDSIIAGAQDYLRKDELHDAPIDRIIHHAVERQRILNENIRLAHDLHEKNIELERAIHRAESAAQAKADFLANMSHEIRTPLTSILGFMDMALATEGVRQDPQASESLTIVHRNSKHLLDVINDILDVSKVEAGAMQLELIPVELPELLQQVLAFFEPQTVQNQLKLLTTFESGMPGWFMLDPTRLRQILTNLVGNAVKFTDTGSIEIIVSSKASGHDEHRVTIQIIDTGIGMSKAQLEAVSSFEAYTQANSSTTRQFGGTGLGLRISQGLAKLMGGTISIDSVQGKGCRATLNFTAQVAQQELNTKPRFSGIHAPVNLSGLTVLVVDDSEDNRRLFKHIFSKHGASIELAHDGKACIDRMNDQDRTPPDLIFLDIQMPVMDGLETIRVLRSDQCTIPVYATSASTSITDQRTALNAGFDGFVGKPINFGQLLNIALDVRNAA